MPVKGAALVFFVLLREVKNIFNDIFQRTPSDVPRTAELIESDSGPGKTVTVTDPGTHKYSYQSGFHIISGITPIKDSSIYSTDIVSYGMSYSIDNCTPSNMQRMGL